MSLPIVGQAHVCHRCAQRGPTCCEPAEGVALAPLTPGDVKRIQHVTGVDPSVFTTERVLDDEEAAAFEAQDPVLTGLLGPSRRLVSLAVRDGACFFHRRETGCSVHYDSRPLLCRRFPIVRDGRALSVNPGGACLALEEAADMPSLLKLMGTSVQKLAAIDRAIRADISGRRG